MHKNQIAETILKQLGGRKFIAMTGSKNFIALPDAIRFDLARNASTANKCQVTLRGDDTYDVAFYQQRLSKKTLNVTIEYIAQYDGVYFDQLRDIFTQVTGMLTSLGTLDHS